VFQQTLADQHLSMRSLKTEQCIEKNKKKKKSILYIEKTEDFNWGQKQNQSDLENQSLE
jgi:uncharacterized protein YcgL (UPF0745 family)